jgi:hypothetical protein
MKPCRNAVVGQRRERAALPSSSLAARAMCRIRSIARLSQIGPLRSGHCKSHCTAAGDEGVKALSSGCSALALVIRERVPACEVDVFPLLGRGSRQRRRPQKAGHGQRGQVVRVLGLEVVQQPAERLGAYDPDFAFILLGGLGELGLGLRVPGQIVFVATPAPESDNPLAGGVSADRVRDNAPRARRRAPGPKPSRASALRTSRPAREGSYLVGRLQRRPLLSSSRG